jgi:hypothetical protein
MALETTVNQTLVDYHIEDMIDYYLKIVSPHPQWTLKEKPPNPLFLNKVWQFKFSDKVW